MSPDPNPSDAPQDPELTAYALGELRGDDHADTRASIEARLVNDAQARDYVESVQRLSEQLEQSYAAATEDGLPDNAREALLAPAPLALPSLASSLPSGIDASASGGGVLGRIMPYAAVAACAALAATWGLIFVQGGLSPQANEQAREPAASPALAETPADVPPQVQPEAQAPPTERELTLARLETRVSVDYQETPWSEVIDHLREVTGTNFMVDWPALELVGIDQDTLVTLKLDDVPARAVLDYAVQQVSAENFDDDKMGYRVGDQVVEMSPLRDLKMDTVTRIYDIDTLLVRRSLAAQFRHNLLAAARRSNSFTLGSNSGGSNGGGGGAGLFSDGPPKSQSDDLDSLSRDVHGRPFQLPAEPGYLGDPPRFTDAPQFDLNDALTNSGGSNSGGGGLFADDGGGGLFGSDRDMEEGDLSREGMIDQLTYLVQDTVGDPDEWLDEESTIREINGQLVIKSTPENHEHIAQLLAGLEREVLPDENGDGLPDNDEDAALLAALLLEDVERGLVAVEQRQAERAWERQRQALLAQTHDNPFHTARQVPLSTFSVDVDTASYAITRRAVMQDGRLPMPTAVRIEEMINYFDYGYDAPVVDQQLLDRGLLTTDALVQLEAADESFVPFATHVAVTDCPWAEGHQLVRIGIKGMDVDRATRPPAHLVFLLDVSGSMNRADKLPLVQNAMGLLLDQLREGDKVSIVVYAGAAGLVLEAHEASDAQTIRDAINRLAAGGSTAGGAGIHLAYRTASDHYIPGGINRVILCTDGDFNVGTSDTDALVELVKLNANPAIELDDDDALLERQSVYLSVAGFGTGNLNDAMMERISNAGNGNYAYIDTLQEAIRVFAQQASSTIVTIAKDVKIQIEFNPAQVARYRLIGYENRILQAEDFNNDTVDAGDIGAGHTVTALYEVIPVGHPDADPDVELVRDAGVDELVYQQPRTLTQQAALGDLFTLKLRYKPVDAAAEQGTSRRIVTNIPAGFIAFAEADDDLRFAAAVAGLGMVLRDSPYRGDLDLDWVAQTASGTLGDDIHGQRTGFVELTRRTQGVLDAANGEDE